MANLSVTYNGLTMCPTCDIRTPYVTREDSFEYIGGKNHRVTNISLAGKIFSDDDDITNDTEFQSINTYRNNILSAFSEDFKALTAGNYTFDYIVVKEVSFSEANVGVVDFTINLQSYTHFFEDTSTKVTNPKNEWTFTEQEDGMVVVRHSISATGKNLLGDTDGSDAVAVAKSFCDGLKGTDTRPVPALGDLGSVSFGQTPFSISEVSNRVEGSYSIEETYKQGKTSDVGSVEKYDIDVKFGVGDKFMNVSVNYSTQSPPGTDMSSWVLGVDLPDSSDLFTKASSYVWSGKTLYSTPLSFQTTELPDEGKITISASFNTRELDVSATYNTTSVGYTYQTITGYVAAGGETAVLDYDVSAKIDEVKEITSVSIDATMVAEGPLTVKKTTTDEWYDSIVAAAASPEGFLYPIASYWYSVQDSANDSLMGGSDYWSLNPIPTSYSVTRSDKTGDIKLNAVFDNRDQMYYENRDGTVVTTDTPSDTIWASNFSFSVKQKPAINVYSMKGGMNSTADFADYLIFDHNTLRKESTTFSLKFSPWTSLDTVTNFSPGSVGKRIVADLLLNIALGSAGGGSLNENPSAPFLQNPKDNDRQRYRTIESQDSSDTQNGILSSNKKLEFNGSVTIDQTVTNSFL